VGIPILFHHPANDFDMGNVNKIQYRRRAHLCIFHEVAERIPNEEAGFILATNIRERRCLKNPEKRGP